ncbi:amidase [Hyphococcus flavus]|uniref:Amidase n=1 Tax=Hyphococcus flavus TaxID=1866326 RepID=A0AAF0CFK7_9PROT|nr:amidase [Hyphococcus flavus]WDI31514.1 amidase [Hyphococcus flavus]
MSLTRRSLIERGAMGASLIAMGAACSRSDQKASNDLAELDGVETAARIKSGELSATEAVDAAIERAKRIDRQINAIVTKTFDKAREEAGNASGPWAGVPTFVKDLDDVTGVRTAFGSRAFPGYKGEEQNPLINAFLGLGVVSLGKSSTPEFGLSATTEPVSSGKTRNPWNTDYSTGGSSGGAAALVASGVVPIAHASDGGGSIRIPASCCGNVGLKVSRGRNPIARPHTVVGPISLSVHGAQTRTVRDTAAVAAALALPESENGLVPLGLVSAPATRRLRIGVTTKGLGGAEPDKQVEDATMRVAELCASLGHQVEPVELPIDENLDQDFGLYWAAFAHSAVKVWEEATGLPRNGLAFEPFTLGLARRFEAEQDKFEDSIKRLQAVEGVMAGVHETYDLILSPVVTAPPPKIGYLGGSLDYDTLIVRLFDYVQYTVLCNITGAPAISLPLSMSQEGLPIGAMFGAALGQEEILLQLAYELEEAAPWAGRRPAVFG